MTTQRERATEWDLTHAVGEEYILHLSTGNTVSLYILALMLILKYLFKGRQETRGGRKTILIIIIT